MAKRQRVKRYDSSSVQGEDSWVIVASQTVAEVRKLQKLAKGKDADAFEIGVTVMKTHVREWNWVNDDGDPLSQPKDEPEVIELLTNDEVVFLGKCILGSEADAKN